MDEAEAEGPAEYSEDQQWKDGRQLKTLGDDLAGDAHCHGGDEGRENSVHSAFLRRSS